MAQGRQDLRSRRLAELEARVLELQAKIAALEKRCTARELSLLEDGLRLSQENEVLRMELAALKKSRRGTD